MKTVLSSITAIIITSVAMPAFAKGGVGNLLTERSRMIYSSAFTDGAFAGFVLGIIAGAVIMYFCVRKK